MSSRVKHSSLFCPFVSFEEEKVFWKRHINVSYGTMTLGPTTFSIMTLGLTTFRKMTLSIMTLSMTTFRKMALHYDTHHYDTQHYGTQHNDTSYRVPLCWVSFTPSVENKLIMQSVVMLSVVRLNVVAPTFCVDFREKCIIGVTFSSTQKDDLIKLFLP
jgi:hypothetical protein